jgi:endonuclease/exonuclease/phosphatase family metal-dependent hydrolase
MSGEDQKDEISLEQWASINAELSRDPQEYGLPQRNDDSIILASFNIRKLGNVDKRKDQVWNFLGRVCQHFDLIAIQEIQDDLSGIKRLKSVMGDDYGMVVTDTTGAVPGSAAGMTERLGFIFNWKRVSRTEVAADISYDRAEIFKTLQAQKDAIWQALNDTEEGETPNIPVFLTFIRTPQIVSFSVKDPDEKAPAYEFMAVNAHLVYGTEAEARDQEFEALAGWLKERARLKSKSYYPNFILLGDLNLETDSHKKVFDKTKSIKQWNQELGDDVEVNFPFLDRHKGHAEIFRTNARKKSTFDQIAVFGRDRRLPSHKVNETKMGDERDGPDYGLFDFVRLFSTALNWGDAPKYECFEHAVSDHMPIWLRLPNPYRSMHVVDMKGEKVRQGDHGGWRAKVTLKVINNNGEPVEGAIVEGAWSGDFSADRKIDTTDSQGKCQYLSEPLDDQSAKTKFVVTNITDDNSGLKYHLGGNYDALHFSYEIHAESVGEGVKNQDGTWDARAVVRVHDSLHKPLAGAEVNGAFSKQRKQQLRTDAEGKCEFLATNLTATQTTFTLKKVDLAEFTYDPSRNHGTNHKSDRRKVVVSRPK